jgi:hypothetical protein
VGNQTSYRFQRLVDWPYPVRGLIKVARVSKMTRQKTQSCLMRSRILNLTTICALLETKRQFWNKLDNMNTEDEFRKKRDLIQKSRGSQKLKYGQCGEMSVCK